MRLLLSIAATKQWGLQQMAAKNTFRKGLVKPLIYFQPPAGCRTEEDEVWLLKKAMNRLKNVPLIFYKTSSDILIQLGFRISTLDPCVAFYSKRSVIVAVYADDVLITGPSAECIQSTKQQLSNKFDMQYMGTQNKLLGINLKKGFELHKD